MKKYIVLLFSLLLITHIVYSQNGWVEQTSGVTVQLTSISGTYYYTNTVWVCGYSGTVLRTTNYGTNWQNESGNGIPNTAQLVSISAVDGNIAVTAGYIGSNTFLYRTTNAGANWSEVFTETNGFIDAVCLTTNINGFMAGDPVTGSNRWSLWKTTNAGVSWDSSGLTLVKGSATEAGWNNAMFCNGTKIWIGTNNSRIYYSSNNGTNWSIQSTGSEVNSYALWLSVYSNFQDGLTGGSSLLITSNSGLNWNTQTSIGTGNFGGIVSIPFPVDEISSINMTWYVRSDNKIYFSPIGAQSWQVHYTAPGSGTYRYIKTMDNFGPFFAVRTDGGITYHSIIVGIQHIGNEISNSFSLSQNYPNPFNPITKINFDIPVGNGRDRSVKLIIYDILGREMTTLVNEELKPGTYSVDWNASNYSSGIYFYRLEAGDFTETKKMVLMK